MNRRKHEYESEPASSLYGHSLGSRALNLKSIGQTAHASSFLCSWLEGGRDRQTDGRREGGREGGRGGR